MRGGTKQRTEFVAKCVDDPPEALRVKSDGERKQHLNY